MAQFAPRIAALVLAALLALLGLAALRGVFRVRSATSHARQAVLQSEAYHQLAYDGAIELAIEEQDLSTPSPSLAAAHRLNAAKLSNDLRTAIGHETDPGRRRELQALVAPFAAYLQLVNRMFQEVSRGQDRRSSLAFQRSVYPLFVASVSGLEQDASRAHRRAVDALDSLTATERSVIEVTGSILGVGLVLLAGCVTVLLIYRRRAHWGRAQELERLRVAAFTDSLTGLGNFRAFQERAPIELAQADGDHPMSLTMLDLNGLKLINDRLGHSHGDEQLCRVAEALRELMGPGSCAYRIGGDEFALLAPDQGAWDAFNLTKRLEEKLNALAACGVSAGIAEASTTMTLTELVRQADLARREAKASHQGALVYTADLATSEPPGRSAADRHVRTLAGALARAVDAKDSYTRSHSQTVSQISAQIAEQLGLPSVRVAKIRLAGLLHDVGKIGISDSILHKPQALTAEEYEIIKTHTVLGHSILSSAELDEEAYWVLHHHEHWDGGGYPDRMSGNQIPLESRIIGVADAFEAITSDRPYRRRSSPDVALEELRQGAGTQFDAACVQALERVLHRPGALPVLEPQLASAS